MSKTVEDVLNALLKLLQGQFCLLHLYSYLQLRLYPTGFRPSGPACRQAGRYSGDICSPRDYRCAGWSWRPLES